MGVEIKKITRVIRRGRRTFAERILHLRGPNTTTITISTHLPSPAATPTPHLQFLTNVSLLTTQDHFFSCRSIGITISKSLFEGNLTLGCIKCLSPMINWLEIPILSIPYILILLFIFSVSLPEVGDGGWVGIYVFFSLPTVFCSSSPTSAPSMSRQH